MNIYLSRTVNSIESVSERIRSERRKTLDSDVECAIRIARREIPIMRGAHDMIRFGILCFSRSFCCPYLEITSFFSTPNATGSAIIPQLVIQTDLIRH